MKHPLFLLATVTLSSTLYAQGVLTRAQAERVFTQYNPSLVERAAQNNDLHTVLDEVIEAYLQKQPQDTLANRYELIALARNFDNSLALQALTQQYQQAVLYTHMGGNTQDAARVHAQEALQPVLARMWAVSVQVKQQLLSRYQADPTIRAQYAPVIAALQADLKNLQTNVGLQLQAIAQQTLDAAQEEVRAQLHAQQAAQTNNLQLKNKHKKPVAE